MSKHTAHDRINEIDGRRIEVERRVVAAALLGADAKQISAWEWQGPTVTQVRETLCKHGVLVEHGRLDSKKYTFTYTIDNQARAYLQLPAEIPSSGARRELIHGGAVVDSDSYNLIRGILGDGFRHHMLPEWQAPTVPRADEWEWRVD